MKNELVVPCIKVEKGDIYSIEGHNYVVFFVSEDIMGLIQKEKAHFMNHNSKYFLKQVEEGEYVKVVREEESASPNVPLEEYERIRNLSMIMDQLLKEQYPNWEDLTKPTPNNNLNRAADQAKYSIKHFRRLFYRYLRGGCDMSSLIDNRHLKMANLQKAQNSLCCTAQESFVLTHKEESFLYGLKVFEKTLHVGKAYDEMSILYYSKKIIVVENGVLMTKIEELPDVPSYYALYRFINKNLGGKTITEYIKGEKETRNNERNLTGNQRSGIITIGQAVQMDESEFSVEITDGFGRVIGKAVVYCAFDPFAQIITGLYIGLYNNYIGGVINTLFSMMEPHEEQTKRVGVHCDEYSFPSLYLPKIIYDDRGSEYMSSMMRDAMHELGIRTIPVPVAAGSYKGGVENVFHRLQSRLKRELIDDGYILTTHEGPCLAKENAVLTLDDYRAIVYRDAIEINTTSLGDLFSPDMDLIVNNIPPVPAEIWKWKLRTCFEAISITDNNKKLKSFSLLWRDRTFIRDRSGIVYKGYDLRFFVEEEWFYEMLKSKDAVDIRYNETDITHVFVRYKGIVHDPVPLSAARDELRTFSCLSWDAYDTLCKEYEQTKKIQKKKDRNIHLTTVYQNDETLAIARSAHDGIVNDTKSIPDARALELVRIEQDPNEVRNRILGVKQKSIEQDNSVLENETSGHDEEPTAGNKYENLTSEDLAAMVEEDE